MFISVSTKQGGFPGDGGAYFPGVCEERYKRETRGGNLLACSATVGSSSGSCGGSCNLKAVLPCTGERASFSTPEDNLRGEADEGRRSEPNPAVREDLAPAVESGAKATETAFITLFLLSSHSGSTDFLPPPTRAHIGNRLSDGRTLPS